MSAETRIQPDWRTYRFDEIATNVNERVDDPSEAGVDYYVGLEHLDADSLTIRRWGSPTDVQATKLRFRTGDIIFGRRRVYQRKLGVAVFDGICSAHSMVVRAKSEVVLPEFLPFFMQSDLFMERAKGISVGSLSPTINWPALAREEFLLPPIEEQRRIASALTAIEASHEANRRLASAGEKAMEALIAQELSACQSTVPSTHLQEHAHVQYGLTLGPSRRGATQTIPYLRVANVLRGSVDVSEIKWAGRLPGDDTYKLCPGDVLVVEGHANVHEIGRAAVWRSRDGDMFHQNHLIRVRCTDTLDPEYLALAINSGVGRGYFRAQAKNTSGLNTINSTVVKQFPLSVPSVSTQRAIVRTAMLAAKAVGGARDRSGAVHVFKRSILEQLNRA
jgi:restriction endonuclease S subunit